ncbi:hypothetical protein AB4340_18300, partial [Vibrio breoganii]
TFDIPQCRFEISNRGAKRCVLTQVQHSPKPVILERSYRVSTILVFHNANPRSPIGGFKRCLSTQAQKLTETRHTRALLSSIYF